MDLGIQHSPLARLRRRMRASARRVKRAGGWRWALIVAGAAALGACVWQVTYNPMEGVTTTALLIWLGPGGEHANHRR